MRPLPAAHRPAHGTFQNPNRPGGVQVALRWFGNPAGHTLPPGIPGCCGEFDTLHLWVYKDGALVAARRDHRRVAVGVPAEPENGWYDVWIAYDPSYNVAPFVEYRGARRSGVPAQAVSHQACCQISRSTAPSGSRSTRRRFPIFEPDPPAGSSCFAARWRKTVRRRACASTRSSPTWARARLNRLRRARRRHARWQCAVSVSQRVYESDGSFTDGQANLTYHGVHGHYHYSSFANALLWRSDRARRQAGPRAGGGVAQGQLLHGRHPHRRLG